MGPDCILSDISLINMAVLLKLMTQTDGTIHYFAKVMRTSSRSIQRHLDFIRKLGFPVTYNRYTNEFHLVSDYAIPPVKFNQSEVLALLVLFEKYGHQIEEPLFSSITGAVLKMVSTLSPELLEMVIELHSRIQINSLQTNIDNEYCDFFNIMLENMRNRKVLYMEYKSPSVPGIIKTMFHPYMVMYGRSWYVIGYSGLYREVRTFKISRIQGLQPTEQQFQMPPNFSMEQYLGNAWNFIREPGPDQEVTIRFSSKVALNVSEIRWHKTQQVRSLPDGQIELVFTVSGLSEILWWILGYGAEAEVIRPPKLRQMIAEHVAKMSHIYIDKECHT